MKGSSRWKAFLVSFFSTLCLLILSIGIVEVDYHSRRIGFGDDHTLLQEITGKNWHIGCFISKM